MSKVTSKDLRNIVKTEYPYKGKILDLRVDSVQFPSGSVKIREVVEHKSAVAILPVNSEEKICLVSQYRHAIDQDIFEIPAGLADAGEDPSETALRELREEIGYTASSITKISAFFSSPGYSTEKIILYYAHDLSASKLPEDDDEYITVHWFTCHEIEDMISSGEIEDGKTIMAYYWYKSEKSKK